MPEWLYPILLGAGFTLFAFIWRTHENHDKERDDRIWDQVGRDSESGMRRTVHATANLCTGYHGEIMDMKGRLERLERFANGKLK